MSIESNRTVEARLRAAVESSPSGLIMIGGDGNIVLVNREVERLFGYSREEMLGRPIEMLIPERFRGHHPGFRGGFMHNPSVRSMGAGRELFGLRKDGSEVPVEIGLTPVATEEGFFVISSIVDISARKRADERFRAAVESSPNGMVMVDGAGKIVMVNREVERLFGYSREELLGQTIEKLVPARFHAQHPMFREGYGHKPETRAMGMGRELYGLHKNGTEVPVEIGLNPIETEEGTFILSSIVDISARKKADREREQLEQQLRQSQKMEAVGRLAGGIAHDFNNILGAIVGFTELAREEEDRTESLADLDHVFSAAMRGKELVDRILRFSRRQEVKPAPMDLSTAVSDASRLLRATLPAGIEIRHHYEPSAPRVMADGTSIHQVVMNLGTNAAHAMPKGGVLEISIESFYARDNFARAHSLHEGNFVLLTVHDNGIGMDEETQARAFEPFFTTKAPGSGSGLGLAMVHGIMQDHGGTAWIESEPDKGTSVKCILPAIHAEAAETSVESSSTPQGHGERILFIDDEPDLVTIGRRRLSGFGYRVEGVHDPRMALEAFNANPGAYDLVITDLSMPHMNGLELAKAMTAARPDLPVILLTGYMEDFPEEQWPEAGLRLVIKKPITAATMAQVVHATLYPA